MSFMLNMKETNLIILKIYVYIYIYLSNNYATSKTEG